MKSFKQYILTELFETPWSFNAKSRRAEGKWVTMVYNYTSRKPSRNSPKDRDWYEDIDVMFHFDPSLEHGGTTLGITLTDAWSVEFYRDSSSRTTGEGDASSVFATVLDALERFIKEYKPKTLWFVAEKSELDLKSGILHTGSRIRLYSSLIKRFASKFGYAYDSSVEGASSARSALFVLHRKG